MEAESFTKRRFAALGLVLATLLIVVVLMGGEKDKSVVRVVTFVENENKTKTNTHTHTQTQNKTKQCGSSKCMNT